MGEFIKLISDAGDNPRFAVADAKQLLKLYEEQYAYLGDTLVNQIAKLLGGISDDAVVGEEKGARFLWAVRMLKNPVSNCMTPVFSGKRFVLSGDFEMYGGKSTAAEMIEEAGGSVTKTGPSKRINYVIVGDRGNAAWAFGSYGTKVKSMPWN